MKTSRMLTITEEPRQRKGGGLMPRTFSVVEAVPNEGWSRAREGVRATELAAIVNEFTSAAPAGIEDAA